MRFARSGAQLEQISCELQGAMTHGYASGATEDAVQKNIVSAGYKGASHAS
jgi:hypothetical protein